MNEEILAALKSATEHSYSLEEAIQSLINAGYNQKEVRETAYLLSKGFSPLPNISATAKEEIKRPEEKKEDEKIPATAQLIQTAEPQTQFPKKQASRGAIVLIIILLFLVFAGIIFSILVFKDKFNQFLNIFP